ncbi:MAG: 5-deoxy-glucuronate isomerase [Planctomycetes bacterium]|nr:5-deoxy-glucuronate isomerase [Planctomycetota bacterium]
MRRTLDIYRERLRTGEIDPLVHWDGRTNGLVFDPADARTPLTLLGFGACRLDREPYRIETLQRELVLVPLQGRFEIRIGAETFEGQRSGPFASRPGGSNGWAIYAPADSTVEIVGSGELVYYAAPARGHKPPASVEPGHGREFISGAGVWRREVTLLASPETVTTALVVGETYSPPGLWSGTPLHVHDLDDPDHGQSDHEEAYFHLARHTAGEWGPYSVQLLMDGQGLNRAYVIRDHDAFAVAGGAHPVVAGPAGDLLYVWGLAGTGSDLKMWDVPEFAYLKKIGQVLEELAKSHPRPALSAAAVARVVREHDLTDEQAHVLRMHMKQQGFEFSGP